MKHMFKHVGIAALALTLLLSGCGQTAGQTSEQGAGEDAGNPSTQAISLVTDIPTTQYFTDEAVKEDVHHPHRRRQRPQCHERPALALYRHHGPGHAPADRR